MVIVLLIKENTYTIIAKFFVTKFKVLLNNISQSIEGFDSHLTGETFFNIGKYSIIRTQPYFPLL